MSEHTDTDTEPVMVSYLDYDTEKECYRVVYLASTGQTFEASGSARHEEGSGAWWSKHELYQRHDGSWHVGLTFEEWGRDCDGHYHHTSRSTCPIDRLTAQTRIEDDGSPVCLPAWEPYHGSRPWGTF